MKKIKEEELLLIKKQQENLDTIRSKINEQNINFESDKKLNFIERKKRPKLELPKLLPPTQYSFQSIQMPTARVEWTMFGMAYFQLGKVV